MTIEQIASDFVRLCKAGELEEAGRKYWADDVVSIEPGSGPMALVQGTQAVTAKGEWWTANHEVHGFTTDGPYVDGQRFLVRFTMDVTPKATGERMQLDELGVYTVANSLIVEERFIYAQPAAS